MRDKLYTERVDLCLSKDQSKRLKKIANNQELRINQVIRNIIEEHIQGINSK